MLEQAKDERRARPYEETMVAAAELTIGALDPPAGALDAPLVQMLRDLARLMDEALEDLDVGWYCRHSVAMVRVLRELRATRATSR